MKQNEFMEGISEIDEELLERSERNKETTQTKEESKNTKTQKVIHSWHGTGLIAAAALIVIFLAAIVWRANHKPAANGEAGETIEMKSGATHILDQYLISEAKYLEVLKKPDQWDFDEDKNGVLNTQESNAFFEAAQEWVDKVVEWKEVEGYDQEFGRSRLVEFNAKVMQRFLKELNHENKIYSPINVYIALGMLAEISEGNTKKQILDLLGMESTEDVRIQVKGLWNRVYRDDNMKDILAASVWLRDDIPYKKETLDILAEDYYASSYAGKMGSEEYSQAFRRWLNNQTDGVLKEQIEELGFSEDTVMALATTVCFNAKWMEEFREENTKPAVFHAEEGDMQRDFMNNSGTGYYYYGDHFGAVLKFFDAGTANMAFILPDEGISAYDLLIDEQLFDFIEEGLQYKNKKSAIINLSIPKFDVSSDRDLIEELRELGITDAFEKATANFSPITDEVENIWISKVQHGVRVITDEKGVKAASYTVETADGATAMIRNEIDFVLDRPFLFVISAENGIPLFVGIVEKP